jgi:acyl-CoA hydrolase
MAQMKAVSPEESKVTMTEIVLPGHTNALGGIFGGVVMSWIDIAAAIAATRHSAKVCVTASVDELHFLKSIHKGFIVNIEARVTYVHNTSCEIKVNVFAENPLKKEKFQTTRAFLTFVAIDENGTPTPMPPLKLETAADKKLAKAAQLRRENRTLLKKKISTEILAG